MKSNKLISMLAMSAVMVACSQEEIATVENQVANNLNQRPFIGNVELGLGEMDSRMALKETSAVNLQFETGDQVGAAIVDAPDYVDTNLAAGQDYTADGGANYSGLNWTWAQYQGNVLKDLSNNVTDDEDGISFETAGAKVSKFYDFVGYISSNYPYTRNEAGAFETQANLVEGNYMFYMPYNASNLTRQSLVAVLPQVQDCSDEVVRTTSFGTSYATALAQFYKGEMEGFENAPVLVGHQFLQAPKDGSVIYPNVSMKHIYAYPKITIKNDFNGYFFNTSDGKGTAAKATATMTIDSIQVYHDVIASNNLFYKKNFNFEALADAMPNWDKNKLTDVVATSALLTGDNMPYANHLDVTETVYEAVWTNLEFKDNHVTMVIGKELENGESYSFHGILPAGNYGKNLKARVYVTIGEKQYVIAKGGTITEVKSGSTVTHTTLTPASVADFAFTDEFNGDQPCQLVHAEQFPRAEIKDDGTGVKGFAGEMMTIYLSEGTAFAVKAASVAVDNGLMTNADLIAYLQNNLQKNVDFTEWKELRGQAQTEWKKYETSPVVKAAGNLAFAENNEIVINSELISALKAQAGTGKMILKSCSLPIANDVKFTESTGVYTFQTLDETTSFIIDMSALTFNTDAEKLVAGINNVTASADVTLKANDADVENAVVVLSDTYEYTYDETSTGISGIYVAAGQTLNIEAACDALIIANGGTINIGTAGSLTNANNVLADVTINNSALRAVAGELSGSAVVKASFPASWPTEAIEANTQINDVTINLSSATTTTSKLSVEQAQIDIFENLTNITLTLSGNIQHINSDANVTLTNIKTLNANSATWYTNNNAGVTIKKYQYGETAAEVTAVTVSTWGTGVTLK